MKIIPFSAILNLITTECFAIWQGGVWHEFFFHYCIMYAMQLSPFDLSSDFQDFYTRFFEDLFWQNLEIVLWLLIISVGNRCHIGYDILDNL